MKSDEYKTIRGFKRAEIKVKGSRFIASVECTESMADVEKFIAAINGEFHDATHNCYAYRYGRGVELNEHYNDHGEPSGTAGIPILNAIKSKELTNTTIVVTRYFGGTKLGTGNLARAYSASATEVLTDKNIIMKIVTAEIKLVTPADTVSAVYHNLNNYKGRVLSEIYNPDAEFRVEVRESVVEDFKSALIEATNGRVNFL
ncbi:MAG: DUF1949 domain-containing protein [candidate division Zixibacteria bacterium]|nr:DUF1949 domain-containing protein [candidate division Zixibacteria bacterium]